MTNNMEEWQPAGVILYTVSHQIPRLKIITQGHTYEIQACKFHPIMDIFAVLVDGKFRAATYDSLERFLKLDEVSKSGKCSEREKQLSDEIDLLQKRLSESERENERLQLKYNDARVVMFDGV